MFDFDTKKERLKEIELESSQPEFWSNNDVAQKILKEKALLKNEIKNIEDVEVGISDGNAIIEILNLEGDDELSAELVKTVSNLETTLQKFELGRMLIGEYDKSNAILEVNSGAGGTDAQDFAEMLFRMYLRWAERRGFSAEILNYNDGEEAGIKSASVLIEGENAYGFLRSERGVHRLVRFSPFNSGGSRETSFASVSVLPEIAEAEKVEVLDDDLRIDTFRAGGAGGQHINKTDSAVRLTHLPTGIVVSCQNERSQHKNKAFAMKVLKAKLFELELLKKQAELDSIAGERKKIDFGSQIRSFVLHPYRMVTDTRTGYKSTNPDTVLDGDLDPFIESYLLSPLHNQG